jgi:uncharacterized repeat protein (TIGR01451 family)
MNTLQSVNVMHQNTSFAKLPAAALSLLLAAIAPAQGLVDPLTIKAIAEVESKIAAGGRQVVKLIPADRVVPGDRVIYTLEVRNTGTAAVDAPTFTHPVPEHMRYVADSAVGPGAAVSYSVDGGRSFDRAENLKVLGADAQLRPAVAADYTHIRWQLKSSLKANSVAFVRFRALVK